ncbi:MAG: sigma factor-like helix-turn-helix DNA-binding protein [Beutenbergiaceae bacterium]
MSSIQLLKEPTPRQRAVIALRYYSDLPDDQIAALMHCSRQAVRNLTHAGLKRLRSILEQSPTAKTEIR